MCLSVFKLKKYLLYAAKKVKKGLGQAAICEYAIKHPLALRLSYVPLTQSVDPLKCAECLAYVRTCHLLLNDVECVEVSVLILAIEKHLLVTFLNLIAILQVEPGCIVNSWIQSNVRVPR